MYTLRQMFQLISGIFLLLISLGFFGIFSIVSTFECQRDTNTCSITRQSWFKQRGYTIPLTEIQHAQLVTIERTRLWLSPQRSYMVDIYTSGRHFPLSPNPSSNYESREALRQQINQFIEDPQQAQLKVQVNDRAAFTMAGLVLLVGASVLIYTALQRMQLKN